MASYSIKDIELLSGIKAHTLRIWEQRYNFLEPKRTETNIRFYDDEQLKKILNISLLYKHGYKISKIDQLTEDKLREEVLKIHTHSSSNEVFMDTLIHCTLEFDEMLFTKTLNQILSKQSFEMGISEVVFPFLQRIGLLWTTGSIRPVQEHFISNLIRKKIISATEALNNSLPEQQRNRFVLFLPEHEMHELLLLFSDYVIRKAGHDTVYVGNCVPWEDMEFIRSKFQPDFLVSFFSTPFPSAGIQQFVSHMSASFPSCKILLGGGVMKAEIHEVPSNVFLCTSYPEFTVHLGPKKQ